MGSATQKSPDVSNPSVSKLYSKPLLSSASAGQSSGSMGRVAKPVPRDGQVSAQLSYSALDTSKSGFKAPSAPTTLASCNQFSSKKPPVSSNKARTSAFTAQLCEKPPTGASMRHFPSSASLSGSLSRGGPKGGVAAAAAATVGSAEGEEPGRENKPRFWDQTFVDVGSNKQETEQNCKTQ